MAVIIPRDVRNFLKAIPKADAVRITDALEQVAADTTLRHSFVTEMVGQPGMWRLRKGDWRAIYEIVGNDVRVDRISHRKDAYK